MAYNIILPWTLRQTYTNSMKAIYGIGKGEMVEVWLRNG